MENFIFCVTKGEISWFKGGMAGLKLIQNKRLIEFEGGKNVTLSCITKTSKWFTEIYFCPIKLHDSFSINISRRKESVS